MIKGFSKYTKEEKRKQVEKLLDRETVELLKKTGLSDAETEALIDSFSENVISTYPLPFSIAPNFLIDDEEFIIPMVTEESSVVAAASKSAAFWHERGGFRTQVLGNCKTGQVHFLWTGSSQLLIDKFLVWKRSLLDAVSEVNQKMVKRGGGIREIELINKTLESNNYYQVHVEFDTCDAMGANYMNSCLELIAQKLTTLAREELSTSGTLEIIMSILSNYSPSNSVKVYVECPIEKLDDGKTGMPVEEFALRFEQAVKIAHFDLNRAVTHNKGIYNGIDAVAIATGNDWRAIEANGHAFASSTGRYKSLSSVQLDDGKFWFGATIPMQVGTVGGTTALHPLAKLSVQLLKKPTAARLMSIIASVGLASNFAAIKSLVTYGIQKGHMRMHLGNILTELNASAVERDEAIPFFLDKTISHAAVEQFIINLRKR